MASKSRNLFTQVAPCITLSLSLTHASPSPFRYRRDAFDSEDVEDEEVNRRQDSTTNSPDVTNSPSTTSSTSTTSTTSPPTSSPFDSASILVDAGTSSVFVSSTTSISITSASISAISINNSIATQSSVTVRASGSAIDPVPTRVFPVIASSSGSSPLTKVAVIASIILGLLVLAGCFLYWRRRRRFLREEEKGRIEAPFGVPPQLLINTAPNQSGIQPYVFAPTSANSYLSPQSSTTLLMKPSSKELALMAANNNNNSPSSANPLLSPGFQQQSLLEQLNALKEHIRHVEAQVARNGTISNEASGTQDNSEPPPEYVAMAYDRTRTTEKSRT
ncbi:unnamed protein product [Cyclocybe aegerita]|uniref:Uncharacterized protein n=1 Tax=Cyclocybe aegerita TaxID=1973307 RepID=A0A8S0WRT6_CYCAE|nr:unnamed protein product [Cyclocybe aegerita]